MRSQQEVAGVVRRKIIAARIVVGVVRIECVLPCKRSFEVMTLAGRFMERQRGTDHGGEI